MSLGLWDVQASSDADVDGWLVAVFVLRKQQDEVDKLIAGPGVYICNECVDLSNEIIEKERTPRR